MSDEKLRVVRATSAFDCGGRCPLRLHVHRGRIVRVEGDGADEAQDLQLRACLRCRAYRQYIHHPERLTKPKKRVSPKGSGQFEAIACSEALDALAVGAGPNELSQPLPPTQAASLAGFDRPILHGLCTYGYATRALVNGPLRGDPDRLKEVIHPFRQPGLSRRPPHHPALARRLHLSAGSGDRQRPGAQKRPGRGVLR
ncbi:MAG: hypothetical protein K9K65_14755 [Desulfarculaceae bacterium]|nr:hypothetical protein [Desulfarculaceae bacterium]MCF8049404.1 hypothetical protein [Desulfarculaceae bacterium]MCF8099100.1 hypothetical protein [Desulfarculaceae bacterium]MCF8124264.1 hypothetical protein [Desulfarculaceae bacterium]